MNPVPGPKAMNSRFLSVLSIIIGTNWWPKTVPCRLWNRWGVLNLHRGQRWGTCFWCSVFGFGIALDLNLGHVGESRRLRESLLGTKRWAAQYSWHQNVIQFITCRTTVAKDSSMALFYRIWLKTRQDIFFPLDLSVCVTVYTKLLSPDGRTSSGTGWLFWLGAPYCTLLMYQSDAPLEVCAAGFTSCFHALCLTFFFFNCIFFK